jgi:hypothetical protein
MACGHPNPKIKAFHVTPAGYCPSIAGQQTISVDWDTEKGDTTLQISPDDPQPRKVDPHGATKFAAHDVTVTLTVSDGQLHPHVIQPVRAVHQHALNGLSTDAGGTCKDGWVTTNPDDFGGGPEAFDPNAHPSFISNKCDATASQTATCHRHAKVMNGEMVNGQFKARFTWDVQPGGTVDVRSSAAPMSAKWVLAHELLPNEVCGTDSAAHALEVDLHLEIDCTRGVAYEQ